MSAPAIVNDTTNATEDGEHSYEFDVKMTCGGCTGAVTRVLAKLPGVNSYDVSLETQKVIVKGTVEYDTVLEKIKKTGKEVRSGKVIS